MTDAIGSPIWLTVWMLIGFYLWAAFRHVPNAIFAIAEVPYTLSGKKMEVPIRKILLGQPLEKAVKRDAMRNPEALAYFVAFKRDG